MIDTGSHPSVVQQQNIYLAFQITRNSSALKLDNPEHIMMDILIVIPKLRDVAHLL